MMAYLRGDPGDALVWIRGLAQFGKVACVRASVGSARAALVAWEKAEPVLRAPHERIAAVEAWLACPCAKHAEVASQLAWANGDDNPLKWTRLFVDGKEIESTAAICAHWSADNAANTVWLEDPELLGQVIETGCSAALAALEDLERDFAARVRRVHASILAEFAEPAERGFLDAVAHGDDAARAVYADWLEERGRLEEAVRQRR